jgi:UDP-2,3-diacylglucosamine hydrolase
MNPLSPRDTILLISDLHLQTGRPELTRAFLAFIASRASQASALYILGDLFNVWIGDDDDAPLCSEVSAALKQLANSGTAVYLLHGNRDFLLGAAYAAACGATLVDEPYLLSHLGQNYLLMHGDVLCTRDEDYQNFRAMVRDARWQQQFLARSLAERRAFAEQARSQSKSMSSNKSSDIMDVTQSAVEQVLVEHATPIMIHGHTHRPALHQFTLNDQLYERLVIGDWDQYGWFVELDASGAKQYRFDLHSGELLA